MVMDEPVLSAHDCADRVRVIQELLFGQTLGNSFRAEASVLMKESVERFRASARDTFGVLLDKTFQDHSLACLALARLARTRPHNAMIFLALDHAKLALMNPRDKAAHDLIVADISRTRDAPVGMVLRCLEWLSGS